MKKQTTFAKDAWENLGKDYIKRGFLRESGEGVSHPSRQKIRALLRRLSPCNVLEVGSGPGVEYEGIRSSGLSVDYVGVDVTQNMVFSVHELHPEAKFVVGDAEALPFKSGSFDVALTRHVLEHQTYYEAQLREMFRVARKALLLCFFKPPWHKPDAFHFKDWHHVLAPVNNYNERKMIRFLKALGPCRVRVFRGLGGKGDTTVDHLFLVSKQ